MRQAEEKKMLGGVRDRERERKKRSLKQEIEKGKKLHDGRIKSLIVVWYKKKME